MSDELEGLLGRVEDPALRADLRAHFDRVRAKRTFGLVFESHLPERVNLVEHPIRVGSRVGGSRSDAASSAGLRAINRQRTVSPSAIDSTRCVAARVRGDRGLLLRPGSSANAAKNVTTFAPVSALSLMWPMRGVRYAVHNHSYPASVFSPTWS